MTPKEKAKELFDKFYPAIDLAESDFPIKNVVITVCLIAIDELINTSPSSKWQQTSFGTIEECNEYNKIIFKEYWQEVKQELEKL